MVRSAQVGARLLVAGLMGTRPDGKARAPLAQATAVTVQKGAGWFVWLAGILTLGEIWGLYTADPEASASIAALRHLIGATFIVFFGFVVLSFMGALMDAHAPTRVSAMPGEDDDPAASVQSRLGTVMPVLRGFMLGAIIGVTALIALSRLGIDTGPLLAGFGIFGLAVSFGSQALVRDIVSGIFFMTEDAFRVGEYIDTGKLKGTVEKITLRSVQLRHQGGQVHTIPFGQIASVTNASRDWATVKFNIRLDRSADIEKVRKSIKKVGQEMLGEPELAAEVILPLKMQGIADIVDNAIVCRLKFTSKPARSSWVQREALKRVYKTLHEAGIEFANNAVMVRSSEGVPSAGAGAAAGQTTIDRAQRLAESA